MSFKVYENFWPLKWANLTPEQFRGDTKNTKASAVPQTLSQNHTEKCLTNSNVVDLTHSPIKKECELLYQIALGFACRGQHHHAIQILETLVERDIQINTLKLLSYVHLVHGINMKSAYHLERSHILATSMLQTTPLKDDEKIELIAYAANSFIELIRCQKYDYSQAFLSNMINSIDILFQLGGLDEHKAETSLSVGHVRIIIGDLFSHREETRSFSEKHLKCAIAIFKKALDLKLISPTSRSSLFFNLTIAYRLVNDIESARNAFNVGLLIAKTSCPHLLCHYEKLEALITKDPSFVS